MKIIPTILCGGEGSRLWPVSRSMHPKPFITLEDGQSLLQKAYLRAISIPGVEEVVILSNEAYYFKTLDDIHPLIPSSVYTTFMLEPVGRNTAPAIAAAALYIQEVHGNDAMMLVLAADHRIEPTERFIADVQSAQALASQGKLVTFGIPPTSPETGYGYIQTQVLGEQNVLQAREVLAFIEKPDQVTANEFYQSKQYLWNSGMFCFKASSVVQAMNHYCPELLEGTRAAYLQASIQKSTQQLVCRLNKALFQEVVSDSIDYALMEPASRNSGDVWVVPARFTWSDIGSWQAISEQLPHDAEGNRIEGTGHLIQSSDCYVRSSDRFVGGIGLNHLMIIDTPDALLVADKSCSQQVKQLYAHLKSIQHPIHQQHRTVHRPWGSYTVLEESERYKIKRIEVKPQAALSLQMHHHRSEHWIVVSGTAKVVNGEQSYLLSINQSTYIPAGQQHRLENPGVMDLVMIEVQSGEYLGEDDIVRFDDQYGRVAL